MGPCLSSHNQLLLLLSFCSMRMKCFTQRLTLLCCKWVAFHWLCKHLLVPCCLLGYCSGLELMVLLHLKYWEFPPPHLIQSLLFSIHKETRLKQVWKTEDCNELPEGERKRNWTATELNCSACKFKHFFEQTSTLWLPQGVLLPP